MAEARLSHAQVANAFRRVAAENGAREFAAVGRSHVSHWVAGSTPSGWGPVILAEALSRRLGRVTTVDEIGLVTQTLSSRMRLDWDVDTLMALIDLGRADVDLERRHVLISAAYSVAALAVPVGSWWTQMAARGSERAVAGSRAVGRGDLEAVREMALMFSRIDQRRGGGHARTAVVQYLTSDVASYLRGTYADDRVREGMFSAAGELAYLAGWMAFDNSEHAIAQRYFTVAVKLAAEADDAPMVGHVLRAMAHQAIDLGHYKHGLDLAAASLGGNRYQLACPRERALLGVVHAKALGAAGQQQAAVTALLQAEDDLAAVSTGDEEPSRVFFFGEASLAHETACTLRDTRDLTGAIREFRRSVRTREATTFTRTHAVTLGYLGAIQVRSGDIEEACATWSKALGAMDGIHSGRARRVVQDMRSALSSLGGRGVTAANELDERAAAYLVAAQ
ncbi:MAG: Tat pathway signal protein [Actinomycetota bacterium]|nr:Tat pathway signal protein [Actinomycetota bacterium]